MFILTPGKADNRQEDLETADERCNLFTITSSNATMFKCLNLSWNGSGLYYCINEITSLF